MKVADEAGFGGRQQEEHELNDAKRQEERCVRANGRKDGVQGSRHLVTAKCPTLTATRPERGMTSPTPLRSCAHASPKSSPLMDLSKKRTATLCPVHFSLVFPEKCAGTRKKYCGIVLSLFVRYLSASKVRLNSGLLGTTHKPIVPTCTLLVSLQSTQLVFAHPFRFASQGQRNP